MIAVEGRGTDRIIRQMNGLPEVRALHSTNGTWDLIAEIATQTLDEFDTVLGKIRKIDGIVRSETNLLLIDQETRLSTPCGGLNPKGDKAQAI